MHWGFFLWPPQQSGNRRRAGRKSMLLPPRVFLKGESGATAIEYAIIAGGICDRDNRNRL